MSEFIVGRRQPAVSWLALDDQRFRAIEQSSRGKRLAEQRLGRLFQPAGSWAAALVCRSFGIETFNQGTALYPEAWNQNGIVVVANLRDDFTRLTGLELNLRAKPAQEIGSTERRLASFATSDGFLVSASLGVSPACYGGVRANQQLHVTELNPALRSLVAVALEI